MGTIQGSHGVPIRMGMITHEGGEKPNAIRIFLMVSHWLSWDPNKTFLYGKKNYNIFVCRKDSVLHKTVKVLLRNIWLIMCFIQLPWE